jgi:hypothetical protein
MCGNDPVGEAMGDAYDRSADALVMAVAAARNGLVTLGVGVRMSALNYSVAEAQSDVSRRAQPLPAPRSTGQITASSPLSSVGAGDSAPAGWGWVAKYIGMIWPNGDSARLRSAAGAWITAGSQLLITETSAATPLGVVGSQQIPEGEMIGQAFSAALAAASQIMAQTATVAGQLSSYANQVDAVHAAIIDLLSRICDPMTGIKEIWDVLTDEDEDEIKQIADDIKTVVDNFACLSTPAHHGPSDGTDPHDPHDSDGDLPGPEGVAGSIRSVNPGNGDMNCVNCVITTDQMLDGVKVSAAPDGPKTHQLLGIILWLKLLRDRR